MNQAIRNKKAEVSFLIPNKIGLKPKGIKYDKGHFTMLKAIIHNENTILMDIHVPKNTPIRYLTLNRIKYT